MSFVFFKKIKLQKTWQFTLLMCIIKNLNMLSLCNLNYKNNFNDVRI